MSKPTNLVRLFLCTMFLLISALSAVWACCPAPPSGKPVVNADQTVIIVWDKDKEMQHFIRKASFKSDAEDFGFIVPSPEEPKLSESGNDAFPYLKKVTEPEIITKQAPSSGVGCGCGAAPQSAGKSAEPKIVTNAVNVLQEKELAGFKAVVLETTSSTALIDWLKKNGYAYSPEVKAWAEPYIKKNWKFTALKVAKDKKTGKAKKELATKALRISFHTKRPLFPYREPDPSSFAKALGVERRLLRIYFLADARYQGKLGNGQSWSGNVAWAGKLSKSDTASILKELNLPEKSGPAQWWLTEFEDNWEYKPAPADVYFSQSSDQSNVRRDPIIQYVRVSYPTDVTAYAIALVLFLPPLWRRIRRRKLIEKPNRP